MKRFIREGQVQAEMYHQHSTGILLYNAYWRVLNWTVVSNLSQTFVKLQRRRPEGGGHLCLSNKAHETSHELEYVLEQMIEHPLANISEVVPFLPSMRDAYRGVKTITNNLAGQNPTLALKNHASAEAKQIHRAFQLVCDEHLRNVHDFRNLTVATQKVIDQDQKGPQNPSTWVFEEFAQLSLISELRHQLRRFQPWAPWGYTTQDKAVNNHAHLRRYEEQTLGQFLGYCDLAAPDPVSDEIHCPETPEDSRPESATAWSNQRLAAEARMDIFWTGLHESLGGANDDGTSQPVPLNVPAASVLIELYEMRWYELGKEREKRKARAESDKSENSRGTRSKSVRQEPPSVRLLWKRSTVQRATETRQFLAQKLQHRWMI